MQFIRMCTAKLNYVKFSSMDNTCRTRLFYTSDKCSNLRSVYSRQHVRKLDQDNCTGVQYICSRFLCSTQPVAKKEQVSVVFVRTNGERTTVKGKEGDSLLDVVVDHNVDIDGFGACEGTLACSTCHLIFSEKDYERIKDKPTDEEMDMLDLAFGLSDTSRLGCQVFLTKELDGLEIKVPDTINDAREV